MTRILRPVWIAAPALLGLAGLLGGQPTPALAQQSPARSAAPVQIKAAPPTSPEATPAPKETPPPPGAPKSLKLPTPVERSLANGMRVVVAPRPGSGLISVVMEIRGAGGAADPPNAAGLADMTASLLTKGTRSQSAPQIAAAIETLGGSLSAEAGWDAAVVSLSVMSTRIDAALPIMAQCVLRAQFPVAELERQRAQAIDALVVDLQEPGTIARNASQRVLYGGQPYGHPLSGTPDSLRRIRRTMIQAFYLGAYQPGQSILVFGGDIAPDDAYAMADRYFGAWRGTPAAPPVAGGGVTTASKRRVVVIDKPDAGQAAVELVHLGIARRDPDYYVGLLGSEILGGGGLSSRLNQEIRVKRGLTYGAYSSLEARLQPGPFRAIVQTRNEAAGEVGALLASLTRGLATNPPTAAELTRNQLTLIGSFERSVETGGGLAAAAGRLAVYGVPLTALATFPDRIRGVTASQVSAFATKRLNADTASIVIVGKAETLLPEVKKRFTGNVIELIPVDKVDFGSPSLQK